MLDPYAIETFKELVKEFDVKTVVETGTHKADSTVQFAEIVDNTVSIEIIEEKFEHAKARFQREGYELVGDSPNKAWLMKSNREVTLYCGNSPEVIRPIIGKLKEPILFYLDAHWLAYWPLKDEIRAIKPRPNSLIIIHDVKVPGKDFGYDVWNGNTMIPGRIPGVLDYVLPEGMLANEYLTYKDDLAYVNPSYKIFYNEKAAGDYRGILYAVPSKEG